MRGVIALAVVAGCSFEYGFASQPDAARPDRPADVAIPPWQIDSMSNKPVPAAAFEWEQLLAATDAPVMPPDHLWLMQDASGGLQDSIGSVVLDPVGNPLYSQPVMGWSRKAVGTIDTNLHQGFYTMATGNLNGPSYLLLFYVAVVATPATERSLFGIGISGDHRWVSMTPAPAFKGTGYNIMPTTGTMNPMFTVHPIVLKIDQPQMAYVVYTDQEKLIVNWVGTVGMGPFMTVGNAVEVGAAPARYMYGALWQGSKAELSDDAVKKLLQALGWTVSGY